MIGSALGHFDETETRVDKKLWCAHLLRELTGIDENHPEGMSAHDIKLMSDNDLLDMDYFLHEFDDDDDFGEEGFYLF